MSEESRYLTLSLEELMRTLKGKTKMLEKLKRLSEELLLVFVIEIEEKDSIERLVVCIHQAIGTDI